MPSRPAPRRIAVAAERALLGAIMQLAALLLERRLRRRRRGR
jgi:hypothetical protein